jgi:hypothetical protein
VLKKSDVSFGVIREAIRQREAVEQQNQLAKTARK